jgi:hypothetical protein
MRECLESTAIQQPVGQAWLSVPDDQVPVTGATSLALLALIESGVRSPVVLEGIRFIQAVQNRSGAWSEIPGREDSCQNTFNALRALTAAEAAGLMTSMELTVFLKSARVWLDSVVRHSKRWGTTELAFGLRLAGLLNLLDLDRFATMAETLRSRRLQTLHQSSDLYADTEIAALALLETARRVKTGMDEKRWSRLWQLPVIPPPFLRQDTYLYDVLYGAIRSARWVRFIDLVARHGVLERAIATLIGSIAALGVVDQRVSNAFMITQINAHSVTVTITLASIVCLWLGLKVAARSGVRSLLTTTIGSLIAATALLWIVDGVGPEPRQLPLLSLYWLIVDAVVFTADRTGLLARVLPQ